MRANGKLTLLCLSLSLLALLLKTAQADPPPGKGYMLVFNDDFNGPSLDLNSWSYNYPWGTYQNARANMDPSMVTLNNGILTLTAVDQRSIWDPWGFWSDTFNTYIPLDYTSGTINTYGKKSWQYGYFEGRFKMPSQPSTWPAFWMLQNGWPPELDIFEVKGSRTQDFYTYHYSDSNNNPASFGGVYNGPDLSADWHNYGVEWTPTALSFYVDDQLVQSFTDPTDISQMTGMYFLIDLQVGGWAPNPTPAEFYPAHLQVDWVRVWQLGGPPSGEYQIRPYTAPTRLLEVNGYSTSNGSMIDIWDGGPGENQIWGLTQESDGSYRIQAYPDWSWLSPNQVIDMNGYNTADTASISTWADNGGSNQRWYFVPEPNGYYGILNQYDVSQGYLRGLDLKNFGTADGTTVTMYDFYGNEINDGNQLWGLAGVNGTATPGPQTLIAYNVAPSTLSTTQATVTWLTNWLADSALDYGTTTNYGQTLTDSTLVTSHGMTLTGLTPNTVYHYRIRANDTLGDTFAAPDGVFTTGAVDVTKDVRVTPTNTHLDRTTNHYVQQVTIKNVGRSLIQGTFALALDHLSSNATLWNATSTTSATTPTGSSYIDAPPGDLAPGEHITLLLQFNNSNTAQPITYTARVLAGPGTR